MQDVKCAFTDHHRERVCIVYHAHEAADAFSCKDSDLLDEVQLLVRCV